MKISSTSRQITPRAWMESATCCGMEWARSAVWNHHEVMYGINPKENTRWRVMPYAYGDSILTCGEITYQSFGLDKKRTKHSLLSFFVCSDLNRCYCFFTLLSVFSIHIKSRGFCTSATERP